MQNGTPSTFWGPRLRTYRLPRPIGSNQNCEGAEESDNLLIFILYPKTPHAQNAHLFDPGHVCTTFRFRVPGARLNSGGSWASREAAATGGPESSKHSLREGALPVSRASFPEGSGRFKGADPRLKKTKRPSDRKLADSRSA